MIQRAFELLRARTVDPSLPDELIAMRGKLIVRGSTGRA